MKFSCVSLDHKKVMLLDQNDSRKGKTSSGDKVRNYYKTIRLKRFSGQCSFLLILFFSKEVSYIRDFLLKVLFHLLKKVNFNLPHPFP